MNPAGSMRVFHCAKSDFCSPAVLQEEFPVQGFAQGLADGDDDQHQEMCIRDRLGAKMPWQAGAALVAISMLLTFLAGLIPSSLAAKKDPVVALRTE